VPQQVAPLIEEYYQLPVQQDDIIAQMERLGALYAQGLLTEDEFAAQKAKLLSMQFYITSSGSAPSITRGQ